MSAPGIDSGYPKKAKDFGSGYNSIIVLDSIRDQYGYFYVVGGLRSVGETYYDPYVWKFNNGMSFIRQYKITGSIFESLKSYHHVVSGISIRSDGSVHIVGVYHSGIERHVWYSYLQVNDVFFEPVQVDTGNPSGEKQNGYNIEGVKIHANSNDDLAVVWTGAGWDTRAPGSNVACVKIKKSDDSWTSVGYLIPLSAGAGTGHIHICGSRDESNKFYFSCFDTSGSKQSYKLNEVFVSNGSVTINNIFENINWYYNAQYGVNCLVDDPDGNVYTLFCDSNSSYRMYTSKQDSYAYFPAVEQHVDNRNRTIAFNDTYGLFIYWDGGSSQMEMRKKILSSIYNFGWDGVTKLVDFNFYLTSPSRTYPIINSKRISVPESGFIVWGGTTDDVLGTGESDPCIYVWSIDNSSWPEPEPKPTLIIKYAKRTNNPGWNTETVISGTRPQVSLAQDNYVYLSYLDAFDYMRLVRRQVTSSGWNDPWITGSGILNFQTQWSYFPRGNLKAYNEPIQGVSIIVEKSGVYYSKIVNAELDTGYSFNNLGAVISGSV